MKLKLLISLISLTLLTLFSTTASAQDLSVRGEVGVAIPLTSKQDKDFSPGASFSLKPEYSPIKYLGFGPEITEVILPGAGQEFNRTGTALSLGGFVRVKRPHNNDGSYAGISPWAGLNVDYVRTDDLNRAGVGAEIGAAGPVDDDKKFWFGPFISYNIYNQPNGHTGFDNSSAKLLSVGLSLEYDGSPKSETKTNDQQVVYYVPEQPKKEEPKPVQKTETKATEPLTFTAVVQFPFDSSKLAPSQNKVLKDVLEAATKDTVSKITLEGHASSEGERSYNQKLSQRRADAVKAYLVANGVSADRITAIGKGIDYPVAPNDTEKNRSLNRRTEFNVVFTFQKQ